jgi:hypothetical protein
MHRFLLAAWIGGMALGCTETRASTSSQTEVNRVPVTDCGGKGLPDCPMQGWMKDSVRAYMNAGDHARLAEALDKLAALVPVGYSGWELISKRGADAARAGDTAAIKAECKNCHDQFREKFRAEMRGAMLF